MSLLSKTKKICCPRQAVPAKDWEIQSAARMMLSVKSAQPSAGTPPGKRLRILAQESWTGQEGIPRIFKYTHKLEKSRGQNPASD